MKMLSMFNENYLSLKDIEAGFKKCNCIKYAAYRTAAKLRIIQKALHLDKVSVKLVSNVFERHHLQQTENSVQLDQNEVISVLSDIYFVVEKENNSLQNLDYVSELTFSLLLNIFDKKLLNTLQVFSFKVGLTLLCQAKPREKYHYLFEQLADHNNCLSRKKLEFLLKKMIMLTEHIGETLSFGSDLIPGTVESCFKCNIGSLGISEDIFMSWLMQDPQLLVWLSTFYRMQISETVLHNAKCGLCKIYPLVGLRYRCLRCLYLDMCQSCFFTGKHSKKHKLKHPVQEYCCPMTPQQSTKAFLLTLRNRLYKKDCKLQYLPALKVDISDTESYSHSAQLLDEMESSSVTVINGSKISLQRFSCRELQNIIIHLERESEKIIPHIESFCAKIENAEISEHKAHLKNCLLKHKAQIRNQVQKLAVLRNYLTSKKIFDAKAFLASTPMVNENFGIAQKKDFNVDLENFSPITIRPYKRRQDLNNGKKMMWDNFDLINGGSNPSWEEVNSAERETEQQTEPSGCPKKSTDYHQAPTADENNFELSCWLGGKTLREFEDHQDSSWRELSWLNEGKDGKGGEDKIREENEETFEELQSDLKKILAKLQELSVVTCREDSDGKDSEIASATKSNIEIDVAEVDMLLVNLISGMEKLMGS